MEKIQTFITSQENRYKTIPIPIVDNYEWNMSRHVKLTTLYLNSKFETGNDDQKPFRNIVLPAINLQHRAVAFQVKEIEFFVDDKDAYYKSFLVRKYHEKWAREHNLQNFLDELTEAYTDYGGVLLKRVPNSIPRVVQFQGLGFCDQTDMLSGVICEKHQYTADKFKEMEAKGWGNPEYGATGTVDDVLDVALNQKTTTQVNGRSIETTSPYVEVYELHGMMPESWLKDGGDPHKYVYQMQIQTMYTKQGAKTDNEPIKLFCGKEKPGTYKFLKRDPVYGRAMGRGGVEELFEPQVWVNYAEILRKEQLDAGSKTFYTTDDPTFTGRNQTNNIENGEILVRAPNTDFTPVNNEPKSLVGFENMLNSWSQLAQQTSASDDSINGAPPKDGVPFRAQQLANSEAHSLHEYRKEKVGEFLEEVYKDWIIPQIQKDLTTDKEFISELSLDEMQAVADQVVTAKVNSELKRRILAGFMVGPGESDKLSETYKQMFFKNGNKKFFKLFKDELKGLPMDIEINISGNQKDMAMIAQKLSSVFAQVSQFLQVDPDFFSNHPEMLSMFNQILEASGLSPLQYSTVKSVPNTSSQNNGQNKPQQQPSTNGQTQPQPNGQIMPSPIQLGQNTAQPVALNVAQ